MSYNIHGSTGVNIHGSTGLKNSSNAYIDTLNRERANSYGNNDFVLCLGNVSYYRNEIKEAGRKGFISNYRFTKNDCLPTIALATVDSGEKDLSGNKIILRDVPVKFVKHFSYSSYGTSYYKFTIEEISEEEYRKLSDFYKILQEIDIPYQKDGEFKFREIPDPIDDSIITCAVSYEGTDYIAKIDTSKETNYISVLKSQHKPEVIFGDIHFTGKRVCDSGFSPSYLNLFNRDYNKALSLYPTSEWQSCREFIYKCYVEDAKEELKNENLHFYEYMKSLSDLCVSSGLTYYDDNFSITVRDDLTKVDATTDSKSGVEVDNGQDDYLTFNATGKQVSTFLSDCTYDFDAFMDWISNSSGNAYKVQLAGLLAEHALQTIGVDVSEKRESNIVGKVRRMTPKKETCV